MIEKNDDLSELRSVNSDLFNAILGLFASIAYIYVLNLKRNELLSPSENKSKNKNGISLDNRLKYIDIIALIISIKCIIDDNYLIDTKHKVTLDDHLEYIASLFEIVSIIIQLKVYLNPSENIILEFPPE